MALRVLLADESSTIKRVIQLSLQDFAVEIKSVNLGIDVVEVAKKFQPDIVFADVLLQKCNGYEVAKEIKSCPELAHVPTILMWSGFIDLDEQKYQESGADGRLEKPFDAETLRSIVREFVPKTAQQSLSKFLSFPKVEPPPLPSVPTNQVGEEDVDIDEEEVTLGTLPPLPKVPNNPSATETTTASQTNTSATNNAQGWTMESFDDLPDLNELLPDMTELQTPVEPIANSQPPAPPRPRRFKQAPEPWPMEDQVEAESSLSEEDDDLWAHKDLTQFKVDDTEEASEPDVEYELDESPIYEEDFMKSSSSPNPPLNKRAIPREDNNARASDTGLSKVVATTNRQPLASTSQIESRGETPEPETNLGQELELEEISPIDQHFGGYGTHDTSETRISEVYESAPVHTSLSHEEMAAIIRAESRKVIETIAREVIPDMAERLIREELDRLLTEKEAQP